MPASCTRLPAMLSKSAPAGRPELALGRSSSAWDTVPPHPQKSQHNEHHQDCEDEDQPYPVPAFACGLDLRQSDLSCARHGHALRFSRFSTHYVNDVEGDTRATGSRRHACRLGRLSL